MSVMPVAKLSPEKLQVPPLENGDHLDQETFHERYEAMPENVRAELIGGSGKFFDLKPDDDGILRSRIFPGLWLDPAALLARDLSRVNQVLNQGIASPEHLAFVSKLSDPNA